jgi:putative acetyltransferase
MIQSNRKIQLIDLALYPDRIEEARSIIREYANSPGVDLCLENFDQEMASFLNEYSSPAGGALLLAQDEGKIAGCVAIRRISDGVCEMKRLYVRPANRGKGIGRLLAESILERARNLGHKRVRLETLPSMREAISMYKTMGFKPIEPYRENPVQGALYLELTLQV